MTSLVAPRPVQGTADLNRSVSDALDRLQEAVAVAKAGAGSGEVSERLAHARVEAGRALRRVPRRQLPNDVAVRALSMVRAIREAGAYDELFAESIMGEFQDAEPKLPGMLARMLVAPAWGWSAAPRIGDVPDWMWGEYAEWLFSVPHRPLTAAQAEAYAAHLYRHATELARWVERNFGSVSVRGAAEAFIQNVSLVPLAPMNASLRPLAQTRARIVTRVYAYPVSAATPVATPRAGRTLRVGILSRDLEASGETYATLARIEQLDRAQFEVMAFTLRDSDAPLATHVRNRVATLHVLPGDPESQLAVLRESNLDVLVFAGSLQGSLDSFTRLALHRTAPLQVRLGNAAHTCGLPEIDLLIGGDLTADVAQFTERIGVLRGPATAYAITSVGGEGEPGLDRAALNVPAEAALLVTIVGPGQLSAGNAAAWARILAGTPDARLLIYVGPRQELAQADGARFVAALDAALAAGGVASLRVTILAPTQSSHVDARAVLRLADVFLYPQTGGDPVWLAEALVRGVPSIVAEPGAACGENEMLRACAAADQLVADADGYVQRAILLARDAAARRAVAERIAVAIEQGVDFLDTLGAGDAFGDLLQAAFDELEMAGQAAFRRERAPLTCAVPGAGEAAVAAGFASLAEGDVAMARQQAGWALRQEPRAARARFLRGRVLAAEGDFARATAYLVAAVQQLPAEADLWFELATTLRLDGQPAEAIQALETCLRLDRTRAVGWLRLHEWAEAAGAPDLAQEALAILRLVAPDHPRVAPLAERLAS